MTPCRYIHKTIRFMNGDCTFFTYSNVLEFDGYKKVYSEAAQVGAGTKNQYKNGEKFKAKNIVATKHISEPPARYNQASLVKALDDAGVGRPSTYRMMVDVNPERGYCEVKNKAFFMTAIGNSVIEGCVAKVEKRVANKTKNIKARSLNVGRKCPKCGKPLVYRFSKITKKQFIGCSDYPKCKYAEFPGTKELDVKCPVCGHNLVQRTSKRGRPFIGCSNYPKCNFICNKIEDVTNCKNTKSKK